MKITIKLYLTIIILLLGAYTSAQQLTASDLSIIYNTPLTEFNKRYLIGKIASIEIYLYSENDFIVSDSGPTQWSSNPEYIIFIKEKKKIKAYSCTSELSAAIYDILSYSEKYKCKKHLNEIKKVILKLIEKKGEVHEIIYEQNDDCIYAYWISHYVRHKKRTNFFFINRHISYSPVFILHLSPIQERDTWNEWIVKWQTAIYGRKSHTSHIYSLGDSKNLLLLQSIFENHTVYYDLILKCNDKYYFYLATEAFTALVKEFSKLHKVDDFLNIVKVLCLINPHYSL